MSFTTSRSNLLVPPFLIDDKTEKEYANKVISILETISMNFKQIKITGSKYSKYVLGERNRDIKLIRIPLIPKATCEHVIFYIATMSFFHKTETRIAIDPNLIR